MLTITAEFDAAQQLRSITAEGHSGYADAGSDIVCAAVSALMQALCLGLNEVVCAKDIVTDSRPEVPFMRIAWGGLDTAGIALAKTALLSIKAVAAGYPEFVRVRENNR